jgi:hypothetical protein
MQNVFEFFIDCLIKSTDWWIRLTRREKENRRYSELKIFCHFERIEDLSWIYRMIQRLSCVIYSKSEFASTTKNIVVEILFVSKRFSQKSILQQNNISIHQSKVQIIWINEENVQKFKFFYTFQFDSTISYKRKCFQERIWNFYLSHQEKSKRYNKINNYKINYFFEQDFHFSEETILINKTRNRRRDVNC